MTAQLIGLVHPVVHLRRAQSSRLDCLDCLAAAICRYDIARRIRHEIETNFAAVTLDIAIALFLLSDRIGGNEVPFLRTESVIRNLESNFWGQCPCSAET